MNFSYNTPWKSRRIRVISERPWLNPTDTREFYSCTRGFEADVTYLPQNLRQGPGSSLTVWEPDASSEPERTGVMHSHRAEFAQEDLFLQQLSLFMDSVGEGRLSKRLMPFRESLRGLALADMARESIDLGQPIEYRAFADLHGL